MERPTVLTVLGVLNIVFGVLGVLCTPIALILLFLPVPDGNQMLVAILENHALRAFNVGNYCCTFLTSGMLVAAGIGILQMRQWGRVTAIAYGIVAIVIDLTGTAVQVFVLGSVAARVFGPDIAIAVVAAMFSLVTGCIGLIYPILLIVLMTRPAVREAFLPRNDSVQA
ncbi:MAG: hypothetical protein WCL44_00970 [bacterium]